MRTIEEIFETYCGGDEVIPECYVMDALKARDKEHAEHLKELIETCPTGSAWTTVRNPKEPSIDKIIAAFIDYKIEIEEWKTNISTNNTTL